jgi:hypothetical protein
MLDTATLTSANCTDDIDAKENFSFIWFKNVFQLSLSITTIEKFVGSFTDATNTLFEVVEWAIVWIISFVSRGALSRCFLISLNVINIIIIRLLLDYY